MHSGILERMDRFFRTGDTERNVKALALIDMVEEASGERERKFESFLTQKNAIWEIKAPRKIEAERPTGSDARSIFGNRGARMAAKNGGVNVDAHARSIDQITELLERRSWFWQSLSAEAKEVVKRRVANVSAPDRLPKFLINYLIDHQFITRGDAGKIAVNIKGSYFWGPQVIAGYEKYSAQDMDTLIIIPGKIDRNLDIKLTEDEKKAIFGDSDWTTDVLEIKLYGTENLQPRTTYDNPMNRAISAKHSGVLIYGPDYFKDIPSSALAVKKIKDLVNAITIEEGKYFNAALNPGEINPLEMYRILKAQEKDLLEENLEELRHLEAHLKETNTEQRFRIERRAFVRIMKRINEVGVASAFILSRVDPAIRESFIPSDQEKYLPAFAAKTASTFLTTGVAEAVFQPDFKQAVHRWKEEAKVFVEMLESQLTPADYAALDAPEGARLAQSAPRLARVPDKSQVARIFEKINIREFFGGIRQAHAAAALSGKRLAVTVDDELYTFELSHKNGNLIVASAGDTLILSKIKLGHGRVSKEALADHLSLQDLRTMVESINRKVDEELGKLSVSHDKPVVVHYNLDIFPKRSFEFYLDGLATVAEASRKKAYGQNVYYKAEGSRLAQVKHARVKYPSIFIDDDEEKDLNLTNPAHVKAVPSSYGLTRGVVNVPMAPLEEGEIPAFEATNQLLIFSGRIDLERVPDPFVMAYSTLSGARLAGSVLSSILRGFADMDTVLQHAIRAVTKAFNQAVQFLSFMKRMTEQSA